MIVFDDEQVQRARAAMLPDEVVVEVAETFKVLSSATRGRLIRALSAGELCVNDLSAVLGMSISATSHQLQALRRSGIVGHRTVGKHIYYGLRDSFVARLLTDCVTKKNDIGVGL